MFMNDRYELLRITTRIKYLKELQQRHISRPSFKDEKSHDENAIEDGTAEITKMLTYCHRLGIVFLDILFSKITYVCNYVKIRLKCLG